MRRLRIFSQEKVSWPAFLALFALLCLRGRRRGVRQRNECCRTRGRWCALYGLRTGSRGNIDPDCKKEVRKDKGLLDKNGGRLCPDIPVYLNDHFAAVSVAWLEIGFPAVFLLEYAGESWNAMNLAMDLVICFAAALLCVAVFSTEKTDQSQ